MDIGLITSSETMQAVTAWATQQGFHVLSTDGIMVRVAGTPDQIAATLHVAFTFRHGHWHTTDQPTLPEGVKAVTGLSSHGVLHHYHKIAPMGQAAPTITTNGPMPGYTPQEITAAYQADVPWDGTGQTVGVAEWGSDFLQSDLDQFSQIFKLPQVTASVVNVAGYVPTNDPNAAVEADLDVQWVHGMAPGAAIRVYQANPGTSYSSFALEVSALFNAVIVDEYRPSVLSVSYGNGEVSFSKQDLIAWDLLIEHLGTLGVTVVVAAGDEGAYGMHEPGWPQEANVDAPASCPHALAVGGTTLFMNLQVFEEELAWSNWANYGAGGGGFSRVFDEPLYQFGTVGKRQVPDVCAVADPFTPCFFIWNGQDGNVGGTSVSAPIVAGMLTRVNHARALAKFDPLGFINPVLYDLQKRHIPLCRDITAGNNTCFAVDGYKAQPGYDWVSGWGSPLLNLWLDQLAWGAPKP